MLTRNILVHVLLFIIDYSLYIMSFQRAVVVFLLQSLLVLSVLSIIVYITHLYSNYILK